MVFLFGSGFALNALLSLSITWEKKKGNAFSFHAKFTFCDKSAWLQTNNLLTYYTHVLKMRIELEYELYTSIHYLLRIFCQAWISEIPIHPETFVFRAKPYAPRRIDFSVW